MKVLDLFSGIGGFSLGLHRAGMETVQFVEKEDYCQKVLKKNFPNIPIHGDIKSFNGKQYEKTVSLICGGFPCQPYSLAGKRKGKEDDRHLWAEYFRLIQEIRPRWIIGENVPGIINMELDQVLSDLASENYSSEALIIPACAVNAPHRRDRVWIIGRRKSMGNPKHNGLPTPKESRGFAPPSNNDKEGKNSPRESKGTSKRGNCQDVAYPNQERVQRGEKVRNFEGERKERNKFSFGCGKRTIGENWSVEPELGRVANGIPRRMDRLKGLGNAVVPQIVEIIGNNIMEIERRTQDI